MSGTHQLKHLDGLANSPDRHPAEGVDLDTALDLAQRLSGELDTPRRRELLHAGRHVRGSAYRRVVHSEIASDRANHDLA